MVDTFVEWCRRKHLQFSVAKLKEELIMDMRRTKMLSYTGNNKIGLILLFEEAWVL